MSKLDIINSILNDKFKVKSSVLIEKDKDKQGNIFEMKRNIIASGNISFSLYKYDSKKDIFPFFNKDEIPNLKKMCDYIIFVEEGVHLHILLVELKKGTESAKNQLEVGECFARYLISTINRLKYDLNITDESLHFKKIRISESKSKKVTLRNEIKEKENGVMEYLHPTSFYIMNFLSY